MNWFSEFFKRTRGGDDRPTFAALGAPFELYDAPAADAMDFVPEAECSLCGEEHPVCFELSIGSDVIVKCRACGVENGLGADGRRDGNCHACDGGVVFPPIPEERILCCYRCLREGKAAITKDTELGMITFEQVAEGLTHGSPGLQSTEFEIVPTESDWNRARLPRDVMLELVRTPSYASIQGDNWQFCCRGPMIFVGTWSRADFTTRAPDGDGRKYFEAIVQDPVRGLWDDQLHDVTGIYVFRCPRCGKHKAHWDLA